MKIFPFFRLKIKRFKDNRKYYRSLSNEDKKLYRQAKKTVRRRIKHSPKHVLSIYFGVPGAGKTTFAAWLAKRDLKYGVNVWSNVPITGTFKIEPKDDIGKYMIHDGHLIIDEAGLEYNNREYKKFSEDSTYFYKYHRHYELAVDIFSQGFDDMDKKLRTLAQNLYVVKRSIFPYFIVRRRIGKRVGINELTKEIIDEYYWVPFSRKWIFAPAVWPLFNTISRKEYPAKDWNKW